MVNSKYYIIFFYAILALLGIAVFYFNQFHLNQDYIYYNHILPIAVNILNGAGYVDQNFVPSFYPMWGYVFLQLPGVALGIPEVWTLAFQFIFAITGIVVFYKLFDLQEKIVHIPLFLPYFALSSIKTADGIVATLIIFYLFQLKLYEKNKKTKYLIYAGLIIAAIVNLRTEYIYLPLFQLAIYLIFKKDKIFTLKNHIAIVIIMLFSLIPWAARSAIVTGEWRFTSSNGGAVVYISLGQLPNNAWRISPVDSTAYGIARSYGIDDPFSPAANKIFKELTYKAILEHPLEFAKKMGFNTVKFFTGGVYTGEYANFFISKSERTKIDQKINKENNKLKQFLLLLEFETKSSIPLFIEKIIQITFLLVFLLIIIKSFVLFSKKIIKYKFVSNFELNLTIIVLYKILLIAAIQYEYRHTTGIYLIIFGMSLYFQERKNIQQNNN